MLSPRKPIFAFSKRMKCGWHDTEGYASLHPRLRATRSARAFDLSGRVAGGFNTDLSGLPQIILGQRDKRLCARGYRLSSIILSEAGRWTEGAWKSKKQTRPP